MLRASCVVAGIYNEFKGDGKKEYLANGLVLAVVHVAALDLLEVQIVRHFGQQQHVHQVAACHEEFGDQIHVVVAVLAETLKLLLGRLTITEFLEQVLKLRRSAQKSQSSSEMHNHLHSSHCDPKPGPSSQKDFKPSHLLSLSGKKSGHNAFLQSSSENDSVILSIGKSRILHAQNSHGWHRLHGFKFPFNSNPVMQL